MKVPRCGGHVGTFAPEEGERMADLRLTAEEWERVMKACAWVRVGRCTPCYWRAFLVERLRATGSPELASYIEQLEERWLDVICKQLRQRQGGGIADECTEV